MTDIEKAGQIAKEFPPAHGVECFEAAVMMATWKNEQYKREQLKEKSKIEDFARDYASNVADNEKEYMIVLYAVRKILEYAKDQTNHQLDNPVFWEQTYRTLWETPCHRWRG